jgi:tRNA modification GTPase
LHGRIDLIQAEAVADLIEAVSPRQARAAFDQLQGGLTRAIGQIHGALFDLIARLEASLDFPEEGYHFVEFPTAQSELARLVDQMRALVAEGRRGRIIREGAQVVIAGRANVGKSSIFNRLAGADRAIVTESPGTTRDLITETVAFDGIPITLVDTAGIRDALDAAEQQGVSLAKRSLEVADLIVLALDASCELTDEDRTLVWDTRTRNRVIALNKADLPRAWNGSELQVSLESVVYTSALSGEGLQPLRQAIVKAIGYEGSPHDTIAITNIRHLELLERGATALERASEALRNGLPEELVLTDLQEARALLEEVTGVRTSEDVLAHIFQRFCIGK